MLTNVLFILTGRLFVAKEFQQEMFERQTSRFFDFCILFLYLKN